MQVGGIAANERRYDDAEYALERARAYRPASPLPDHALAVIAAQRGDPAGALTRFQALLDRIEAAGASGERIAANIVQLTAMLGQLAEARKVADRWIPRTRRSGRRLVLGNLLAAGAAVALLQDDLDAFDGWSREAAAVWRDTGRPDPDLASLLDLAAGHPDADRSAVARELADVARASTR